MFRLCRLLDLVHQMVSSTKAAWSITATDLFTAIAGQCSESLSLRQGNLRHLKDFSHLFISICWVLSVACRRHLRCLKCQRASGLTVVVVLDVVEGASGTEATSRHDYNVLATERRKITANSGQQDLGRDVGKILQANIAISRFGDLNSLWTRPNFTSLTSFTGAQANNHNATGQIHIHFQIQIARHTTPITTKYGPQIAEIFSSKFSLIDIQASTTLTIVSIFL